MEVTALAKTRSREQRGEDPLESCVRAGWIFDPRGKASLVQEDFLIYKECQFKKSLGRDLGKWRGTGRGERSIS